MIQPSNETAQEILDITNNHFSKNNIIYVLYAKSGYYSMIPTRLTKFQTGNILNILRKKYKYMYFWIDESQCNGSINEIPLINFFVKK